MPEEERKNNTPIPIKKKTPIYKRFPTKWKEKIKDGDEEKEVQTFLSDKKVSGEIFAYLLSNSIVVYDGPEAKTFCPLSKINKSQIAKKRLFGCKSRTTVQAKFKYLEVKGFLKYDEKKKGYFINTAKEKPFYQDIPLDTIQYILDTFSLPVIKVYLYLGSKYKWWRKHDPNYYNFTKEEIIENCGLPKKDYTLVNNILLNLTNNNFIQTKIIKIVDNNLPDFYMLALTYWNENKPAEKKEEVIYATSAQIRELNKKKAECEKQAREDAENAELLFAMNEEKIQTAEEKASEKIDDIFGVQSAAELAERMLAQQQRTKEEKEMGADPTPAPRPKVIEMPFIIPASR